MRRSTKSVYYLIKNIMNIIKKLIPVGIATFIVLVAAGTLLTSADEAENGKPPHPRFNAELHAQIEEAMEAGDYDAWEALIEGNKFGSKILEYITAENFDRFVEMKNHYKAAKEIHVELGLPSHPGKGMKHKFRGMKKGWTSKGDN